VWSYTPSTIQSGIQLPEVRLHTRPAEGLQREDICPGWLQVPETGVDVCPLLLDYILDPVV